jgi:hypothetical protein
VPNNSVSNNEGVTAVSARRPSYLLLFYQLPVTRTVNVWYHDDLEVAKTSFAKLVTSSSESGSSSLEEIDSTDPLETTGSSDTSDQLMLDPQSASSILAWVRLRLEVLNRHALMIICFVNVSI